jgi:hypothetical protein
MEVKSAKLPAVPRFGACAVVSNGGRRSIIPAEIISNIFFIYDVYIELNCSMSEGSPQPGGICYSIDSNSCIIHASEKEKRAEGNFLLPVSKN